MKFSNAFFIAALSATTLFSSCGNDSAATNDGATETAGAPPGSDTLPVDQNGVQTLTADPVVATPAAPTAPSASIKPAATTEPPQNATGVWHFTCPKGCAGGGGAAGPCAKCKTTLVHNTAYHAGASTPNPASSSAAAAQPSAAPGAAAAAPKQPEPPQNKAGVWHYTCADGCPGGSGSASPCAKCGKTLAHNSAYHQ